MALKKGIPSYIDYNIRIEELESLFCINVVKVYSETFDVHFTTVQPSCFVFTVVMFKKFNGSLYCYIFRDGSVQLK